MIVQVILHASFEPTGVIHDWALKHGHELIEVYPYRGDQLKGLDSFDVLLIMGGPQSPLQADQFPYLYDEMALIREAVLANKKVLGICLGAQLIGQALGAAAERSPHREIGIWPIELTAAGIADPMLEGFPQQFDVAHWHSDMSGVPEGAEVLARSPGCPRQIIRYHDHVYGFQCHPEMTRSVMTRLADHCADDLDGSTYVQSRDQIIAQDFAAINQHAFRFLQRFFA